MESHKHLGTCLVLFVRMESNSDFPLFPSLAAGEAAGMEQGLEF